MPNLRDISRSGGKREQSSEAARLRRREMAQPAVIADFQSIYVALSGDVRDDIMAIIPSVIQTCSRSLERERQRIIRDAVEADIGLRRDVTAMAH